MTDYLIRPRDPLMFRDGRPFAADPGASAESLVMPFPPTLAGALRSLAGQAGGEPWGQSLRTRVYDLKLKGPLLAAAKTQDDWQTYLPAPADAVVCTDSRSGERQVMRLFPWREFSGGCNPAFFRQVNGKENEVQFADDRLLPLKVESEHKPERGFDWWSLGDVAVWLSVVHGAMAGTDASNRVYQIVALALTVAAVVAAGTRAMIGTSRGQRARAASPRSALPGERRASSLTR